MAWGNEGRIREGRYTPKSRLHFGKVFSMSLSRGFSFSRRKIHCFLRLLGVGDVMAFLGWQQWRRLLGKGGLDMDGWIGMD